LCILARQKGTKLWAFAYLQDWLPVRIAICCSKAKLNSILTKVDNMPLGAMGANVNNLLATLNQTLKEADALLSHVDSQLVPQGTKTMEALHRTIADADRVLLGKDAPASQDLHDMMQELTNTARAARVFLEYLQQHPSILIRGKKEEHP
jgi:paraquat-inducible protein B